MKKGLPLVLLAGAILLLCLGLAALGANFFLTRGDKLDLTRWQAPSTQMDAKQINPVNALEALAGIDDSHAIDNALQQGDWESAFAGVAYSFDYSDANRAGTLLLLGARYANAKQTTRAAWCYQYAATLAMLSPAFADLARAQTLLEATQGLRALGMSASARATLDQSYLITEYSTTIPRGPRALLFGQIGSLYKGLGASNLATQAQQKSAEAASDATAEPTTAPRAPYRLALGSLPANQELTDQTQARINAAKELIDALNLHPPKSNQDLPDSLVRKLGTSLYSEDTLQNDYYDAQYKPTAAPDVQAAILSKRIRWLTLKLRVARGGFGLSLASKWEPTAEKIATELSNTYDELFKLTEQQAAATQETVAADRQSEDVLRAEIVAGRWGLYAYDENDLRSRLGDLSEKLRDDQVPALRLDAYTRNGATFYLLVPDELYGQGEKALPK